MWARFVVVCYLKDIKLKTEASISIIVKNQRKPLLNVKFIKSCIFIVSILFFFSFYVYKYLEVLIELL